MTTVVESLDLSDLAWQAQGLCRQETNKAKFFPEQGASATEGKAVCVPCPVKDACLDYALARGERFGVWGGTSAKQRAKMLTAQRKAASAAQTQGVAA